MASGNEVQLLTQLAEMEAGHAEHFSDILAEFEKSSDERQPETDEESDAYLQALTSDRIISTECQIEEGDTYPEILEKAMLIEKNSVFFYTSVKYSLLNEKSVPDLDRLVGEEIGHFRALSDALVAWRSKSR
jgi:rubrerythrin